eukprot:6526813-Pyramimonas_sp.AAC.1
MFCASRLRLCVFIRILLLWLTVSMCVAQRLPVPVSLRTLISGRSSGGWWMTRAGGLRSAK